MAFSAHRRMIMQAIARLALAPALISGRHAIAASAEPTRPFQPPGNQPMHFTRILRRELGDGAAIEVTRHFVLEFEPMHDGWRVEGRQTGVHVTAPAALAPLARLEEQRVETGLFPLTLNQQGHIVAGPAGYQPEDLSKAVDAAFAWLARQRADALTLAAAREFAIGLATVGAKLVSQIPPDLFIGATSGVKRSHDLTMPDGQTGRISVSYTGIAQQPGGLLQRAERIVTTQAGSSVRHSREIWMLKPHSDPEIRVKSPV